MKICMIGTGYVGLVSGACFDDLGNSVWCVDKDKKKINKLNENEIPIYEPGLEEIIHNNFKAGRLKFTSNLSIAVKESDIIFICVGTPPSKLKQSADLKYVFKAYDQNNFPTFEESLYADNYNQHLFIFGLNIIL